MVLKWSILIVAAGLVALFTILRLRRSRIDSEHRRVFNRLALPNLSGDTFDARATVLLPSPASRYLRHAIRDGAPLAPRRTLLRAPCR